jgi:hypothetical protein
MLAEVPVGDEGGEEAQVAVLGGQRAVQRHQAVHVAGSDRPDLQPPSPAEHHTPVARVLVRLRHARIVFSCMAAT